jgi:cardiolipin synthase
MTIKIDKNVVNLPNALTLLRILSIPLLVTTLIYGMHRAALLVFVLAAVTDALDGLIARLANMQTPLGQFLDPLADKFLLVTSYILFAVYGWVPAWLAIIIISRDLIVVVGWFLIYMIHRVTLTKPSIMGKSAIAMQLVLAAYVILKINVGPAMPDPAPLVWATAAATIASGLHYIYRGFTFNNA